MLAGQVIWQGATQVAVSSSTDQEWRVPTSPVASSSIVTVQVPFGFSPMNAANASSGASGVASTPTA